MGDITSIQVSKTSKDEWATLKNHPNESYEDMFNRIIKNVYEDDSDLLTDKDILEIEQSVHDIKAGKFVTHEQLKKKYGL